MARAANYAGELGVDFESAYPGWMREALQWLVGALRAPEAGLVADKLGNVVVELSRFLRQNAEIAGERRRHPEIERERIVRPVFIVGINRSGTTFLHRLLARDRRYYEGWVAGSGSGDAYGYHRRMVQQFAWQRRQATPGQERQWLFKMPFHLKELEALLETHPDALFIQTFGMADVGARRIGT